ncbi:hypothetical protein [Metabacillus litoralis]|uniref:hypothetical protein n=1 Tax=Metabacillus litoralis TaxID=152268 RepID=UPI002041F0BA|nr:hypothetical protein [Metabacillus litoralis]
MLGKGRIPHLEDLEEEAILQRFFGWGKLPNYTTYYNDLKRFKEKGDLQGFTKTNEVLTKRVILFMYLKVSVVYVYTLN